MRPRLAIAQLLLRLGSFLQSLPVVVMRPADMVEYSRRAYERASLSYGTLNDPDAGLSRDEVVLWEKVPCRPGRVLVLGGGGAREAIAFAREGFDVTGVDFSEGMLALTYRRMAERGLDFQGRLGDISQLEVPAESFHVVWISRFLYSVVLGRKRRIEMLRRIHRALRHGGVLVCSFCWDPRARVSRNGERFRKAVAWLTLGNTTYENGDFLFGSLEFRHAFSSEDDLRAEFAAGQFGVSYLSVFDQMGRGGAVLKKLAGEVNNQGDR